MRELFMGRKQVLEQSMDYYLLEEQREDASEKYGIRILCEQETACIRGITDSQCGILSLLDRVMEGLVTPITLLDVVEDWLLQ